MREDTRGVGRFAIAFAAVVAAAFFGAHVAFAQAPPSPPHQFFGDAGAGTGATIDGALAPDGTLVTAINEDGAVIATTTISGGLWLIQVDPEDATSVTFLLDSLVTTNPPIVVQSGALTAVALEAFTTGRVQICHHAGRGGKARTLTVGARAATHHLAHGDSPGPCS